MLKPSVFREYDVRGIVADDFPSADVVEFGRAFGTFLRRNGSKTIALGRDCRDSSPRLAADMTKGLLSTGINIIDVGLVPTPMLYFSLFQYDTDGGVQITGSHNPIEYNGFKLSLGKATLFGSQIQEIRKILEAGRFETGAGKVEERDIKPEYLEYIKGDIKLARKNIKVVLDGGNGTAGPSAVEAIASIGCEVVPLFIEMDARFPNHHPDPTVEKNLRHLIAKVRETKADAGIAFDGDGDRIGVVDETGRIIWGDMILLYLASALTADHKDVPFVADVKCSQLLFDDLTRQGAKPEMFKTGHSLIKNRMKEIGALIAGEMSGHIFYAHRYFGFDDATYTAARFIEIMSHSDAPLSAWFDKLPKLYSTPEMRVDCPEEKKFAVAATAQQWFKAQGYDVNPIDGVRVNFGDGWGLMRASNTQPVVVMRFEATSPARLAEIEKLFRGKFEEWLK